ncbi:hypothetical protein BRE01_32970 [Brevibacillus reuszeri]|uniref:Uncharacterized protein n=1 Tax=Brevibacillus reuszeri TaxID=54915 RepID=A0ABQ0TP15_9BACL|nr:hypothetical protein BRE01_32970 [Brevibacillus reuszeri]
MDLASMSILTNKEATTKKKSKTRVAVTRVIFICCQSFLVSPLSKALAKRHDGWEGL